VAEWEVTVVDWEASVAEWEVTVADSVVSVVSVHMGRQLSIFLILCSFFSTYL
jgi:hypothetical protein